MGLEMEVSIMSEDMNDKSTKKTSDTSSKGSTKSSSSTKSSTTKSDSAKSEAAKSGSVETASEQGGSTQGTSSASEGKTKAGAGTGSSGSAASGTDSGSSTGSGEVFLGNSGLPRHFAAGLSYVLGPITGVIFLLLDRADPFVRFHAAQSLAVSAIIAVVWIAVAILSATFAGMPLVFWAGFIFLLYMAFVAFQSKDWELPTIGDYSQQLAEKVAPEDDKK